jgi:hypothetical protein
MDFHHLLLAGLPAHRQTGTDPGLIGRPAAAFWVP